MPEGSRISQKYTK